MAEEKKVQDSVRKRTRDDSEELFIERVRKKRKIDPSVKVKSPIQIIGGIAQLYPETSVSAAKKWLDTVTAVVLRGNVPKEVVAVLTASVTDVGFYHGVSLEAIQAVPSTVKTIRWIGRRDSLSKDMKVALCNFSRKGAVLKYVDDIVEIDANTPVNIAKKISALMIMAVLRDNVAKEVVAALEDSVVLVVFRGNVPPEAAAALKAPVTRVALRDKVPADSVRALPHTVRQIIFIGNKDDLFQDMRVALRHFIQEGGRVTFSVNIVTPQMAPTASSSNGSTDTHMKTCNGLKQYGFYKAKTKKNPSSSSQDSPALNILK